MSKGWDILFNGALQCVLPRPISDHFPIPLVGGGLRREPTLFRFDNMWLEEGSKEVLKIWWRCLIFNGSFSFLLDAKLRAFIPDLNQ